MKQEKENKRLRKLLGYSLLARKIDNDINRRNFLKHIIIALIVAGCICFCAWQLNDYLSEKIVIDTYTNGDITSVQSVIGGVLNGKN